MSVPFQPVASLMFCPTFTMPGSTISFFNISRRSAAEAVELEKKQASIRRMTSASGDGPIPFLGSVRLGKGYFRTTRKRKYRYAWLRAGYRGMLSEFRRTVQWRV